MKIIMREEGGGDRGEEEGTSKRRRRVSWSQVVTTKAKFTCRKLIVTAGAWINEVLGSIGVHVPVTVTQEQVTYFATPHVKDFTKDRLLYIL